MICMLITFTKCWLCEERIQHILPSRCSLPFTSTVAYIYVIKKQKDFVLFKLLAWWCTLNAFFLNICKDGQWVSPSETSFTAYVKLLPATAFDWVSRHSGKSISDTVFHDTSCIVLIPNVYKWSHFNPINNLFLKNCAVNPFAGQRAMWKVQNFLSNVILRVLLT